MIPRNNSIGNSEDNSDCHSGVPVGAPASESEKLKLVFVDANLFNLSTASRSDPGANETLVEEVIPA